MGVGAVLLIERERSRSRAALMHALGCAAIPGEVLQLRPVEVGQIPGAFLAVCGCHRCAVVVVVEDGVALAIGDGPVERVREFAVEGC